MRTLRVRDIMPSEVHTIQATTSAAEAARMLTSRGIGGAPVLDGNRIVGVVSTKDLTAPRLHATGDGQTKVAAVMTPIVYAVRPGDPVMTAVRLMVEEDLHRAIVVTDDGTLVGIVSAMDVLRALARGDAVQEDDYALDVHREIHSDPAVAVSYVDVRGIGLNS